MFVDVPVSFITEKNKSYGISSFVETKGEAMIAKSAVEFVEYPLLIWSITQSHTFTSHRSTRFWWAEFIVFIVHVPKGWWFAIP